MEIEPPPLLPAFEEAESTPEKTKICESNNNGSSPQMPTLFQADNEPYPQISIQDLFLTLRNGRNESSIKFDEKCEERHDKSESLFEKMYKDFGPTFNTVSDIPNESNKIKDNEDKSSEEKQPKKSVKRQYVKPKSKKITKSKTKPTMFEPNDDFINESDLQKMGIKTKINRNKTNNSTLQNNVENNNKENSVKHKSPFIISRHESPAKKSNISGNITSGGKYTRVLGSEYEIVNPSFRMNEKGAANGKSTATYRPNMKTVINKPFDSNKPAICVFCGQKADFLELGFLYGPYFLDHFHRQIGESLDNEYFEMKQFIFPVKNQNPSTIDSESVTSSVSNKKATKTTKQKLKKKDTTEINRDYRITKDGEVWCHRECVLWAPGTYLRGDGKIGGLDDSVRMALGAECSECHRMGAILNCLTTKCEKNYHYHCAIVQNCKMNDDQLTVICSKHKSKV